MGLSSCRTDYTHQLLHAISKFLPARGLGLQSDDKRRRWTDRLVVVMALLMSWQPAASLLEAFEAARGVLVKMYVSRRRPGQTLAGYLEALQSASDELAASVASCLRRQVEQVCGPLWQWRHWVVLAADGSRIDCPRTAANEEAFGCAGRKKTGPQQFVTTLFHVTSGLIWDYRRGKGTDSEREHLGQMLEGLPSRTLLLMDAGYSGYELLGSLAQSGCDFIVRVGRNVRLLRRLGYYVREHAGIVYLWPQRYRDQEPLVLRCVSVRAGRRHVVLLTSVLEEESLSDAEVAQWYRRRWRVEVHFRSLKQTLGKRKMLSDAPHKAQVELDWAMMGLWMLSLMGAEAAAPSRGAGLSLAGALRAVRQAMRDRGQRVPAGGLRRQLRHARMDTYIRRRPKRARDWPHKKTETICGMPHLRTATRTEVRQAKELKEQWQAA
jgi:hypothetical protein